MSNANKHKGHNQRAGQAHQEPAVQSRSEPVPEQKESSPAVEAAAEPAKPAVEQVPATEAPAVPPAEPVVEVPAAVQEAPPPAVEVQSLVAEKGGRDIHPEMEKFLDSKLKDNGLAQHAIQVKDARTVMRLAAEACVGIREQGGNNKGPLVSLIQDTVGNADHWPWCMSFVQTCIAYAERKTCVQSLVKAHEHVLSVWKLSPVKLRVTAENPLPGAIIIWQKGASASGHTGIVTSCGPAEMTAIEGNTESGISGKKVERDGGGVYHTRRNKKGTGEMRVVGFIAPF